MFVQYSTTVPLGLGTVQRLMHELGSELSDLADIAYREGEELRSKVGPASVVAKSVAIEVGAPEMHKRGLVYPLRWTAVGAESLFPEMRGDLILTQDGMERTTITLSGTYDPPLGAVGRALDRVLLGRVADATARKWVDRLAASINASA